MKISRQDIHSTILNFLELLENKKSDEQVKIASLELALDQLTLLHYFIGDISDDENEYPNPPVRDYSQWRELIGEHFPNLGYYNTPSTISVGVGEAEMLTGDALDDLTDIASDLSKIMWLWEYTSENNALWHLRFSYETHWGSHLKCLQMYLHALRGKR
jgi:hypothetical protein